MKYTKVTYKYKLHRPETFILGASFTFQRNIATKYIDLRGGVLKVATDYCWDGPSGPTIDTKNTMRGSLCHDVLYQLIRLKVISFSLWEDADEELLNILEDEGMSWVRRKLWQAGLKLANGKHANPNTKTTVYTA